MTLPERERTADSVSLRPVERVSSLLVNYLDSFQTSFMLSKVSIFNYRFKFLFRTSGLRRNP